MIDPEQIPDTEHCFFTKNGKMLKNVSELKEELKTMNPEVFNHHVNNDKNDFSNWIRGVFGQERLANKLEDAKTRDDMINVLEQNVALMILMDMPKPGRDEMKHARQVLSLKKNPKHYKVRGESIEAKISPADLAGKKISFREKGTYAPSKIEITTENETSKIKAALEQKNNMVRENLGIPTKTEETPKHQKWHHRIIGENKKDFMHGAVVGGVSIAIIIMLYFAFIKAF